MKKPILQAIKKWIKEYKKVNTFPAEKIEADDLTLENKAYLLFKVILKV